MTLRGYLLRVWVTYLDLPSCYAAQTPRLWRPLGFDKEQVITFNTNYPGLKEKAELVKEALAQVPGVEVVSRFRQMPSERYWDWLDFDIRLARQAHGEGIGGATLGVDSHFVDLMGLRLLAGTNFAEGASAILNETAARRLGFSQPHEALGALVSMLGHLGGQGPVRGVVADFHFESLHHPVGPVVFYHEQRTWVLRLMGIKMAAGDIASTLVRLEEAWRQVVPEYPFIYQFLDDKFARLYYREEVLGHLLSAFSLLAVFVACMGIFALAAFATEQRTKEIGVRKVLGATVAQVVAVLSKEFTGLVAAANIIAWPIAYGAAQYWLADFAYRVDLRFGLFVLGGGLALCGVANGGHAGTKGGAKKSGRCAAA